MRCPACGVEAVSQAVYCHKCGQRLDAAVTSLTPPGDAAGQSGAVRRDAPDPPELELWRGGYGSRAMMSMWAICALVDVALIAAGFLLKLESRHWPILLLALPLPWLYYLAILAYRRWSVHYVLTTQRFIHERGILRRVNDRIEVLDMHDITFEQGLLERLLGVGTINIVSHDVTTPKLSLRGIENVQKVAALFDNARLAERRRRGLHVEQI
jgi:hypothetical protein